MLVYLDNNATTPLDPLVKSAIEPWLGNKFGNPSSRDHAWGWDAQAKIEEARAAVADAARATAGGVIFVSSATEALNAVLRSYVGFADWRHKTIITVATEH